MTKYEKGEKISFGAAINIMNNSGGITYCYGQFYKIVDGELLYLIDERDGWHKSIAQLSGFLKYEWYTAKEAEEKFIPNKAELFGLWINKSRGCLFTLNGYTIYEVELAIKDGSRPATEADLNEFYKKVVEELQK